MNATSPIVRTEVERIARHALTPLAVWLFSESFGDAGALAGAEAATILASYVVVLAWSWYSDFRTARNVKNILNSGETRESSS